MTIIFTFCTVLKNKILRPQGRAKLNTDKDAQQRKNGFFVAQIAHWCVNEKPE